VFARRTYEELMKSITSRGPERSCPICISTSSNTIYSIQFPVNPCFALAPYQDIALCDKCGALYASCSSTQEDYDNYYQSLSKYITYDKSNSPIEVSRFKLTLEDLRPFIPRGRSILDIGCGSGGLLKLLKSEGHDLLSGFDACDLKPQGDFCFYRSELKNLGDSITGTFPLIISTGVLEHVHDLAQLLKQVLAILDDDGYFYVQVPDAAAYQDNVVSPFQDFNLEHINHFTALSLGNLLTRLGFEMIKSHTLLLPESPGYNMPVLSAVAIKSKHTCQFLSPIKDIEIVEKIQRYIEKSEQLLEKFEDKISKNLRGHKQCYIWGAGQLSLKLCQMEVFNSTPILAFIDRSSSLVAINGTTIISDPRQIRSDIPIVVGSVLHQESILKDIKLRSLTNLVITLSD